MFEVSSEMAFEKKQNLEKHIGEQIFDGDVLQAKFLGFRLWPLTTFSFTTVEVPRDVTEKHKNALEHFSNVAEALLKKNAEMEINLSPEDEGLVKRFGNIDSRILNVQYRFNEYSSNDFVTFTLANGLSRTGIVDRCSPKLECFVDISNWVKKCVTPSQSIVVGCIQTAQAIDQKFHTDFFSGCSFAKLYRNALLLEKKLTSTMFVKQQPPIDISNYVAIMCINSDPSTINAVLQTDLREYFVEVLAISNHERTFETRKDEKNPEFIYVHELPSITIWYREMLRHKTIFEVCLALENYGHCNDYTLLWIIKWLPLMDFWSDYKITRVVQGATKSAKKVRESRELKRLTEN